MFWKEPRLLSLCGGKLLAQHQGLFCFFLSSATIWQFLLKRKNIKIACTWSSRGHFGHIWPLNARQQHVACFQFVLSSEHDGWTICSLQLWAAWLPVMWSIGRSHADKCPQLLHFQNCTSASIECPRAKRFRGSRHVCWCAAANLLDMMFPLWLQVPVLDATVFPQPSDLLAMTTPSQLVLLIPFTAGWLTPVSYSAQLHLKSLGDEVSIKMHVDVYKRQKYCTLVRYILSLEIYGDCDPSLFLHSLRVVKYAIQCHWLTTRGRQHFNSCHSFGLMYICYVMWRYTVVCIHFEPSHVPTNVRTLYTVQAMLSPLPPVYCVDSSPGPKYHVDAKITRFGKDGTPSYSMLGRMKKASMIN